MLDEWLAWRKKNKKPVTQRAVDQNLKPYTNNQELKEALEATLAAGWQGIYAPRDNNRNLTPFQPLQQGYKHSQNYINGLHNQAMLKMYEEMEEREEQEKLNKQVTLEIDYDKQKTDGKALDRILSTIPQLNTKARHSR